MPLHDDETIPANAVLLRVMLPGWTTNKGGRYRPSSLAFFSVGQEVSYFLDGPGMLPELHRIFPGLEVARVPVLVIRGVGFAIERRSTECPNDFRCERASHVVAGPSAEVTRIEFQKSAGSIAKHPDVTIISPEPPRPGEPRAPGSAIQ
jgi:hypothetical protein